MLLSHRNIRTIWAGNGAQSGNSSSLPIYKRLSASGPAQDADEKSIRLRPAGRHQQSFGAKPRSLVEQEGAFSERPGDFRRRHDREFRMAAEESAHLSPVLVLEHRAGDVDDAPAGFEERHGAVEHLALVLHPLLERTGAHAPLRVRVTPPCAGAGTRRIDQDGIHTSGEIVEFAPDRLWRPDLHIARTGALEPVVDRRKPPLILIRREDLALVLHKGGER